MQKITHNLLSVKQEQNQIKISILGLKVSFILLNKYKYIIYRRYVYPIIRNDLFHNALNKRDFINYIFLYNKKLTKLRKNFYWHVALFKFFFRCKLDIPVMDFNITTRCTLRCEQCGSLMPFYPQNAQWTIPLEEFKNDLDKLLSFVNIIHRLKLIGGEPLLVKDLDKMLEYAVNKKQIKTVEITTNGTIMFSEDLLNILTKYRKKILVVISNYSSNNELKCLKYDDIKLALEVRQIPYIFPSYPWYLRGKIFKRNRTVKELKYVFKKCWQRDCIALMEGKMHHCTRSIAIQRLSDFEFLSDEFINIRENSPSKNANNLRRFYLKDYFRVCDFCITPNTQRIPRAIQNVDLQKIGDK